MASGRDYLDYVLEQLSGMDEITYRKMMGEYIIYFDSVVIGGIYDNRLLVKPTESALAMTDNPKMALPYEGAKEMLLVEDLDNREYLRELVEKVYDDLLNTSKKRKKKR